MLYFSSLPVQDLFFSSRIISYHLLQLRQTSNNHYYPTNSLSLHRLKYPTPTWLWFEIDILPPYCRLSSQHKRSPQLQLFRKKNTKSLIYISHLHILVQAAISWGLRLKWSCNNKDGKIMAIKDMVVHMQPNQRGREHRRWWWWAGLLFLPRGSDRLLSALFEGVLLDIHSHSCLQAFSCFFFSCQDWMMAWC